MNSITRFRIVFLAVGMVVAGVTATPEGFPPVFLSAIPKCGTHLGIACIKLILKYTSQEQGYRVHSGPWTKLVGRDAGKNFLYGHAICTAEHSAFIGKNNYRGVFIYRDPRDQCVSFIHWTKKGKNPLAWPVLASMDFDTALSSWITDTSLTYSTRKKAKWYDKTIKSFKDINDFYARYLGWMKHPNIYTTSFEKLIGAHGGGSQEVQIGEIMAIAAHIERPITQAVAKKIADSLFGRGGTFRKGQIGAWKEQFNEHHKDLFKKVAGQLLIDLGYETDVNW